MKKLLAMILVLVMAFSLCACGNFGTQMLNAGKKLAEAKSFTVDADMTIDMDLNVMDTTGNVKMLCNMNADVLREPTRSHVTLTLGDGETEDVNSEFYVAAVKDGFDLYVTEDGKKWEKANYSDLEMTAPTFEPEQLLYLLDICKSFKENGEQKINGAACNVFAGMITGENMQNLMSVIGFDTIFEEMTGISMKDVDVASFGDIPTTISVNKETGALAQYTMDFSEVLKTVMTKSMESSLAEMAELPEEASSELTLEDVNGEVVVNKGMLVINLLNYNEVEAFELPEAIEVTTEEVDEVVEEENKTAVAIKDDEAAAEASEGVTIASETDVEAEENDGETESEVEVETAPETKEGKDVSENVKADVKTEKGKTN